MTDYSEEQSNEIEALEAIYPSEICGKFHYIAHGLQWYTGGLKIGIVLRKPFLL